MIYKIKSTRPDLAMRILLKAIGDFPDMKVGVRKGVIITWTSTTTEKMFAFYVYRTKTMWIIEQDEEAP